MDEYIDGGLVRRGQWREEGGARCKPTGPRWSFTASIPSLATISERGLATGRAVGHTTITATSAALINDNAVLIVK